MKESYIRLPAIFTIFTFILFLGVTGCDSSTSSMNGDGDITDPPPAETENCEGEYPCSNIEMEAQLTPEELLGEQLNDIWGWTDPQSGKEYALVAMTDRVTFVDVSVPSEPVVVGTLPEAVDGSSPALIETHHDDEGGKSAWRDVKVYRNHAYVVSDGQPHGLQVFDLTRLRDVDEMPATFEEDLHFTEFGNAHNIAINEETGYAYVAGSNRFGGGLYILDLADPANPQLVGSHQDEMVGTTSDGYVHDTQCVVYNGPDSGYIGRELCFNSSESHFVIADVTDKEATETIARSQYEGNAYAHQGWLTEDHRYFLLNDELDELNGGAQTTTYIWDLQDLDNPEMIGTYESGASIDHNLYVKGEYTYQANYTRGLRIIDISDIGSGELTEVAYFDTFPENDATEFDGAWSNYPFFESGIVVVSDISNGLFILSPDL